MEADRFGIYIIARAGYSTEVAARLLPRLGEALPSLNEPHAAYHTPAARTAAMRQAIEEIATKEVRGVPVASRWIRLREQRFKLHLTPFWNLLDGRALC